MSNTYTHLKTRIKNMEAEYKALLNSPSRTPQMMQRMEEIERVIPYIRDIKWEIVRERLLSPIQE